MEDWYFPRTDLARKYFKVFDVGISASLAMIAPRRKGKTLFLLKDIVGLAKQHGYFPVYVSLWEEMNSPEQAILKALRGAIRALDKKMPVSRFLAPKLRKVSIGNDLLGRVEVEFADAPQRPSTQDLLLLDTLLEQLEQKLKNKKVLLLIDEIQHLATSDCFSPIAHTLRTILDKRPERVKSIFTGSSRHYMNALLSESNSPFFHFPEMVPFPDLGREFTDFVTHELTDRYGLSVNSQAMQEAFLAIDKSPYWMMKLVSYLVVNSAALDDALSYTLQLVDAMNGFDELEKRLKPIDQLVFLALYAGEDPFSKKLLQRVEQETSLKGVYANVQRSLQRLIAYGLVSQAVKGEYILEKAGFGRYLSAKKGSHYAKPCMK